MVEPEQSPKDRYTVARLKREASLLKGKLSALCAGPAGHFSARQRQRIDADVDNLHAALRFCAPPPSVPCAAAAGATSAARRVDVGGTVQRPAAGGQARGRGMKPRPYQRMAIDAAIERALAAKSALM